MSSVAIILARAGSAGVPGKNTRTVAGYPCIWWTIRHATRSRLIDHVCLTTDCERAAAIAREEGVEVIERPSELADDHAPVDEAARHALGTLGAPRFDRIALLYANVPVRPDELTDRAVARLVATGADSVQSYAPVGKHHPWWTCIVSEDGDVRPWTGDTLFHSTFRRQDLPPAHVPDGGVTVVTREALTLVRATPDSGPHAFLGRDRRAVLTGEGEVIDIDSEIDLLVADAALRSREIASASS